MSDICVLYNVEDVEDFATYLKGLFQKGCLETSVTFLQIGSIKDILEISSYKVIVLLCSPCMVEYFDDESVSVRFQPCFRDHAGMVCLQYYVEDEEIAQLQLALSVPKGWKLFQKLETKQECMDTIGSIIDILEEQSRLPPKLPPVKHKRERPKRPSKRPIKLMPSSVYKANEEVAVIFQKAPTGIVQVSFRDFDKIIDLKQYNDTTYILRVPQLPKQGQVRLRILCNSEIVTEVALKIVKPNLAAYECVDYLSQVLGIDPTDRKALDTKLVGLFDKSIPNDGTLAELMSIQTHDMPFHELAESDQEIPTLLHFAAKHGLEDLACTIMDTPGSNAAFQIENKDGLDPADLAEVHCFTELSQHMRTQFETHTMVEYIHLVAQENLYLNEEELQEARKKSERSQSLILTTPKTQGKSAGPDLKAVTLPRLKKPPIPEPSIEENKYSGMNPSEFIGIAPKQNVIETVEPPKSFGSKTHDELVDIGNAVRAGEFTVDEAERLYTSWMDRNKTSQSKSLKERHDAIEELRNQYQTVFKPPKEERQQKSIFTKLKKKIGTKKKLEEDSTYTMHIVHPAATKDSIYHYGRESTISNSSSSSGGSRVSTLSQESFRDSNIGSMPEESDEDENGDGIDPSPVYQVQRRCSDVSDDRKEQNVENRRSLRDQCMERFKSIKEDAPDLPPRPPPSRRPPLPLPTFSAPEVSDKPVPARRKSPPSISKRPPLPIPTQDPTKDTMDSPSPISRRPPAPLPELPSPSITPQSTFRKPPPPPSKRK